MKSCISVELLIFQKMKTNSKKHKMNSEVMQEEMLSDTLRTLSDTLKSLVAVLRAFKLPYDVYRKSRFSIHVKSLMYRV